MVCMDCGLVIEEQLFLDPTANPYRNPSKRKASETDRFPNYYEQSTKSRRTKVKILTGKELVLNVCQRHQLTDIICNEAIKLLEAYINQRAKRGVQINESLYASLALYNTCVSNNVARSKSEIASMFFISVKSLNRLESDFKKEETYIDNVLPSKLIPRVVLLSNSNVNYKICNALGRLADSLYATMCASPNSVLGYVLYQYLNSEYFKGNDEKRKYSLIYVANLCGITPSCIQRIIKLKGKLFDLPESVMLRSQL